MTAPDAAATVTPNALDLMACVGSKKLQTPLDNKVV